MDFVFNFSSQGHELDIPYIEDASENKPFKVSLNFVFKQRLHISSQMWLWVPSLIGILSLSYLPLALSQKVGIYGYGHQG